MGQGSSIIILHEVLITFSVESFSDKLHHLFMFDNHKSGKGINLRRLIFGVIISLVLTGTGDLLVLERRMDSVDNSYRIRGDSLEYMKMIRQEADEADAPFRYRVLVPFLSRFIPVDDPAAALKIVTLISLFFLYLFIFNINSNFSISGAAAGLLLAWSSQIHLYNYHNPYLTDAFGLMMIALMYYALIKRQYPIFILAALIGVLGRESVIFMAPAWLVTKQWKRGTAAIAAPLGVLILLRLIIPGQESYQFKEIFRELNRTGQILHTGLSIFWSWNALWLPGIATLFFIKGKNGKKYRITFALLFSGAFLSSFFATDIKRMFSILMPVMAISCIYMTGYIKVEKSLLFWLLLLLIPFRAILSRPNFIFGHEHFVFQSRMPGYMLLLVQTILFGIIIMFFLKRSQAAKK